MREGKQRDNRLTPLFHHEKTTGEAATRTENISKADRTAPPKVSWHKARERGERASMSETITGRERGGGESPYQDGPHKGFSSKSLLAPEGAERQTPPATEAEPWQEDFNPAPWPKPPKATQPLRPIPYRPVRAGRGEGCLRLRL